MKNITDEELRVINTAIYTRYGLDFRNYESTSLKRRVTRVIHKFQLKSVYGLWTKILYDASFIQVFIDEVTVGLTELFRNPPLWEYLRTKVLPLYRKQSQINIWHAGCSTGEEVYSMIITLYEARLLQNSYLTASDISAEVIKTALEGKYSLDVFQQYNANYQQFTSSSHTLDEYCTQNEDNFLFKASLKENVHFLQQNLTKKIISQPIDILFCRNVMIYFDGILKEQLLEKFYHVLKKDGLFILGYYDMLPKSSKKYFETFNAEFKILRKKT